jgi:hypothetical protein
MTETNNYKWNNNASGMEVVGRERTSFKIDDFSSLPDSLVPGEERRRGAGFVSTGGSSSLGNISQHHEYKYHFVLEFHERSHVLILNKSDNFFVML